MSLSKTSAASYMDGRETISRQELLEKSKGEINGTIVTYVRERGFEGPLESIQIISGIGPIITVASAVIFLALTTGFRDNLFLIKTVVGITGGVVVLGGAGFGISTRLLHRHLNKQLNEQEAGRLLERLRSWNELLWTHPTELQELPH